MDTAEIEAVLKNHEERIAALEGKPVVKEKPQKQDYSGLNGGLQMLLDEGFFNQPKGIAEILSKLKDKVYHYGHAAVSKAVSIYFMKRDRKLTRIKEGGVYKYVVRK